MNMFDEARTISGMIKMCNMTQGEIAKKLGVSQSYVGNKVRLLNFSERVQRLIIAANLSERHARTLLRLDDDELICECIEKITAGKLTVAECEALVDVYKESKIAKHLGVAPKRERVERFEDFLKQAVESMCSLGINATRMTEYYGNKKYITISIEEYI
ncbi:MAG: hypothetical protein IJ515_05175 [Clostridia bacterium]|nr:hypothetical protein [Clostridia bacterium]